MRTFIIAALLVSMPAFAASVGDTYVIPVAGHVTGANGATWVTDVTLHNVTSSTLIVELTAVGADDEFAAVQPATVTIAAHGTLALHDVMQPAAGLGALLATGNAPFTVAARIYTDGLRGSVGQSVTALNEFLAAGTPDAFLTGLVANARYRTNVGFFALAGASELRFEIVLRDATGTPLGTRAFAVPAGQVVHVQIGTREIAPVSFDAATAHVRVTAGDGLVAPYASIVDNQSSDGTFVPAAILSGHAPAVDGLLRHRRRPIM